MIIKKFSKSVHIEGMELLLRRLHVDHPLYEKVRKDIHAASAGDFGEEIILKEIEQLRLPYDIHIYHKLLLRSESAFELDILLITPFGAIILEVKNIVGELAFQENPSQIIQRKENGEINKYPCPATQLNDYKYQLSQFFNDHNIPIPIDGAVIFASRKSFVSTSTNKAKILYKNEIRPYLRKIQIQKQLLTAEEMERIRRIILKKNDPFTYFPLTKYFSINPNELIKGVQCPKCKFIGMKKIKHTWECPKCKRKDQTAYRGAISTYLLLYKDSITNKECRDFLKLNNRHEANRILTNSDLIKVGNTRSAFYRMKPFNQS